MKFFKITFFILILLTAACGSNGPFLPNQAAVNRAINDLTATALADLTGIGDLLQGSATCQDFEQLFTVGQDVTTNCPQSGTLTVNLSSLNCSGTPPNRSQDTGTESFNDCVDNDSTPATVNGSFDFDEDVQVDTGTANITSNNYISEGITFTLDITVILNADGSGTCSGDVTADGFDCILAANCLTCTL